MRADPHVSFPDFITPQARVVIVSGSGMSAESGIPTFRDAQSGLWSRFSPEELATPDAFKSNPARVWQWYEHRCSSIRAAQPHDGHAALVALEELFSHVSVVTQNVDGLHQKAGSGHVIELHGNILNTVCSVTGRGIDTNWLDAHYASPPPSPHHPDGLARPAVVWFGESLDESSLLEAVGLLQNCKLCLVVGTSAQVQPAASLPLIARDACAHLLEINPEPTPLSAVAHDSLRMSASDGLSRVLDILRSSRSLDPTESQFPRS